MSEMVKIVALATCSSLPCICKNRTGFDGMPCLDRARNTISAMREPTKAMIEGASKNASLGGYGFGDDVYQADPKEVWQAMIDEALK